MAGPDFSVSQTLADDALHRVQRLVNQLFTTIVAVLVVLAVSTVSLRYVEAVTEGRREANLLADLLSEYLVIRLRGIDGALSKVAAENRRIGGPEGSEREWAAALRSSIAGVPGLSSLVILDEHGIVQHATVQQIRGVSWAERRIFQELARGIPNHVVVDPPITMVAGNQVLVPFGRALTDPRGNFIGAVVALLLPNQLRQFLGTFDLGETGIAWVLLPSGEVLFRSGAVDPRDGASEVELRFPFDGVPQGDGVASAPLTPGGGSHVTAYRESDIADLSVAVSIGESTYLSRWRIEAIVISTFVLICAALAFFAVRRIKAATVDAVAAGQLDASLNKPG